jgi:hypothetical protein
VPAEEEAAAPAKAACGEKWGLGAAIAGRWVGFSAGEEEKVSETGEGSGGRTSRWGFTVSVRNLRGSLGISRAELALFVFNVGCWGPRAQGRFVLGPKASSSQFLLVLRVFGCHISHLGLS